MSQVAYTNLSEHDSQVLIKRAISPQIAADRGYRTWSTQEARDHGFRGVNARAGLGIPAPNTQGETPGHQLRPHQPTTGDDGRDRKYLWPVDYLTPITGPPAATDTALAEAHRLREDVTVPVVIFESILKMDAAIAAAPGTFYGVSTNGVYGWLTNGAPDPSFRDIPFRIKKHGKVTYRRQAFIVSDSDIDEKQGVSDAAWDLSGFLDRKGAIVHYIDVPAAPDGGKWGNDDALAAGVSWSSLLATAHPAPLIKPVIGRHDATGEQATAPPTPLEAMTRRAVKAENLNRELVRLIENPHVKLSAIRLHLRVGEQAVAKRSRMELEPEGARLSASDISGDWRPTGHKGSLNTDGTRPLMRRDDVISGLRDLQTVIPVIFAEKKSEKKHPVKGRSYGNDIVVEPPESLAAWLHPLAVYAPGVPYQRKENTPAKSKSKPCPHCHEVHDTHRVDTCMGCEKIIKDIIVPAPTVEEMSPEATSWSAPTSPPDQAKSEHATFFVNNTNRDEGREGEQLTINVACSPGAPRRPVTDFPRRGTYVFGRPDSPPNAGEAGDDRHTA
jgi:hypothetical protein